MLLNVSIFLWYGAVCPWDMFLRNDVIPLYRLIPLGILVLLLRRLPWVLAIHKKIPQIEQVRQAVFVGFFGPVGVSAIFYLYITNEFLNTLRGEDGELRSDVAKLPEAVLVVVWFLCICSVVSSVLSLVSLTPAFTFFDWVLSCLATLVWTQLTTTLRAPLALLLSIKFYGSYLLEQVVHGLSIPLGKLGYNLPQTLSRAMTDDADTGNTAPFRIANRVNSIGLRLPTFSSSRRNSEERSRTTGPHSPISSRSNSLRPIWRIGGSLIREDRAGGQRQERTDEGRERLPVTIQTGEEGGLGGGSGSNTPTFEPAKRTIRFPDEAQVGVSHRRGENVPATASGTATPN